MRGLRNLDHGNQRITDDVVRRALRRRGQRMLALANLIAVAATAALFALP